MVGEDAVAVGLGDAGLARVDLVDAAGLQPHQQPLQRLVVLGDHGDHRVRRVVGLPAHVEAVDRVVAAVLPDVVEDPRQDAVVHQVAGDLDGLVDAHPCTLTPGRVLDLRAVVPGVARLAGHLQHEVDEAADEADDQQVAQPGRDRDRQDQAGQQDRRGAEDAGPGQAAVGRERRQRRRRRRLEALLLVVGARLVGDLLVRARERAGVAEAAAERRVRDRADRLGGARRRRLVDLDAVAVVVDDRLPGEPRRPRCAASASRPRSNSSSWGCSGTPTSVCPRA